MGEHINNNEFTENLIDNLAQLGLASEEGKLLFSVSERKKYKKIPSIWFQLEKAESYEANAVFFKKSIRDGEYIPQIYIYDYTQQPIANKESLTEIHKNVWSGGDVPIVCVFSKTETIILDTTRPIVDINGKKSPTYHVENLKTVSKTHQQYYQNLAQQLKSGTYWDNSNVDFNKNSSYSKLTELLRNVINKFTEKSELKNNKGVIQKLIIQCILIKYLEERRDENGDTVFPKSFFSQYAGAGEFSDVLKNGMVFNLFEDLNINHFNGGVFYWDENEKSLVIDKTNALSYLADVLRGYIDEKDQHLLEFEDNFSRLYSFNYIPVELISRLYEEFIIKENKKKNSGDDNGSPKKKKNDGVAYTPSHLVRLLVNEAMPINQIPNNLNDFKLLDPACGSAIFLVVAFKRLVQWWRQQNNYQKPKLNDLKSLLNSIYGIDSDHNAVQISIFSLCIALCDELSPKEIWDDLQFDNFEGNRIIHKDFFVWKKSISKDLLFNVVIGNPPFVRGVLSKEQKIWQVNDNVKTEIPQNQIAIKFLSESLSILKEGGLSCLIVKSIPLLYSSSNNSINYLKTLSLNFHVNQIFDFTPLARNGVLWDGVDVDTAAVFVTNSKPDFNKNVLHAIFRRTKANKERIYFEIDKYDLHFIVRDETYNNPFIFKINLLGGGRLKSLFYKYSRYETIKEFLKRKDCKANEGFMFGNTDAADKAEDFMYEYKTLPTGALSEAGVDFKELDFIDRSQKFISIKNRLTYEYPNIIIKENIGKNRIPIYLNLDRNFTFKDKLIGIYSLHKDKKPIQKLHKSLESFQDLHRLLIFITSSQLLIGKNTAILKEDIMRLPFLSDSHSLSHSEKKIIDDVLKYTQYFIRRPESADALHKLKDIVSEVAFYGQEFSNSINELYAERNNSFKLTNIIHFEKENLIGALFSYDNQNNVKPQIITETEVSQIDSLVNFNINESLTATRIILYYAPNTVLFVKPNQKRYWLASIAYRDADMVFADILNNK